MVARVPDPAAAILHLGAAGMRAQALGDTIRIDVEPGRGADVTRVLAERGIYLSELRPVGVDLETVFLDLTKDEGLAT
jgi:ABC-2 type transport system ATP-binding protein